MQDIVERSGPFGVVIAGAGVIGASIAYHLVQRGMRDVVVLDRAGGLGGGSTAKATGGFRAQFASEIDVRLSLLAREELRRFEEETGVDSGYRPHGYLFLARSQEELDALRDAQAVQHACGLHEARMVTAAEARELNPAIGDVGVIGGAFCPTDGFIRPMNILRGYMEAAQRMGARFVFDCAVEEWTPTSLRTSRGEIRGDVFVNALGAWAGAPVIPLRRNVAATVATDLLPESMPMTIWSGDWYHLRVRDGRVLLLWPDDPPDDATWLARVLSMTRERMPLLRDLAIEETWSGLYEMSPDEHALLGRVPGHANRFIASGSSGHGVMHAPALGKLLAELIVEGRTSVDIGALDPGRLSEFDQWDE